MYLYLVVIISKLKESINWPQTSDWRFVWWSQHLQQSSWPHLGVNVFSFFLFLTNHKNVQKEVLDYLWVLNVRVFSSLQVCKYYLCGFCPAELFTNTRSDLGKDDFLNAFILFYSSLPHCNESFYFTGPCEKIHDENLRKM